MVFSLVVGAPMARDGIARLLDAIDPRRRALRESRRSIRRRHYGSCEVSGKGASLKCDPPGLKVYGDVATTAACPLSPQLRFTRVGHLKSSKSDISNFDRERIGVIATTEARSLGYGLSISLDPSPGSPRRCFASPS